MFSLVRLQVALVCIGVIVAISPLSNAQDRNSRQASQESRGATDADTRAEYFIGSAPFSADGFAQAGRYFNEISEPGLASLSYRAAAILDSSYRPDAERFSRVAEALRASAIELREALRVTVAATPRDTDALSRLAKIELLWPNPREADMLVRRAMSIDDPSYYARLDSLAQLVSESYAISDYYEAVRSLQSARNLAERGNAEASIIAYERLLQSNPGHKLLSKEVAEVHATAGNVTEARRFLKQATKEQSDRDQLIARADMFERAGLLSASISDLVAYFGSHQYDEEIGARLDSLYRLSIGDPFARRQIESVRPNLVLPVADAPGTTDARRHARSPQAKRQSRFALTTTPWVEVHSVSGEDYSYRSRAGGVDLTTHLNPQVGLTVSVSSHSISAENTFLHAERSSQQLTRIGVGVEFGDHNLSREQSRSYRLTLLTGISSSSTGRLMPFLETALSRHTPAGFAIRIDLRTNEGVSASALPSRLQTKARVTLAAMEIRNQPNDIIKFGGRLTASIVNGIDPAILAENVTVTSGLVGTDISVRMGLRILPWVHFGGGFQQTNNDATLDLYWAPRINRRAEVWTEYERELLNRTAIRARAGVAQILQTDFTALPFVDGEMQGFVSDNLVASVRLKIGRDLRSVEDYVVDGSDQLLTVASIAGRLIWNF